MFARTLGHGVKAVLFLRAKEEKAPDDHLQMNDEGCGLSAQWSHSSTAGVGPDRCSNVDLKSRYAAIPRCRREPRRWGAAAAGGVRPPNATVAEMVPRRRVLE